MADIRYALRDGDATTTGGVLIAKGFFFTHHGKTVALEGDTATCPACKAQGRVYNDCTPNFDVMGMRLLVSGARVYCKCAEPPRVIHSQQDFSIEVVAGTGRNPEEDVDERADSIIQPLASMTMRPANRADGHAPKTIDADRRIIEVSIFDSRLVSTGSQFGHASIAFRSDDVVYSRAPARYMKGNFNEYLRSNRTFREVIGVELWITRAEETVLRDELERRVAANDPYNILTNSCSSNVADVLGLIGILAMDPRGIPLSTPADMLATLRRSDRFVREYKYGIQARTARPMRNKPQVESKPRNRKRGWLYRLFGGRS